MRISFANAVDIHPAMAELKSTKAAVEAGNIFNAETPGYRAHEFSIQLDTPAIKLTTTDIYHLKNDSRPNYAVRVNNNSDSMSPDGNNVILAREQAQLAKTLAGFNVSLSMVRERIFMLDKAIVGR